MLFRSKNKNFYFVFVFKEYTPTSTRVTLNGQITLYLYIVSRIAKSTRVVCETFCKRAYVNHHMQSNDIRRSITSTHNHNCLIGTITFKVHHITPTSPKNTLAIIFESILILFALYLFFAYFSF